MWVVSGEYGEKGTRGGWSGRTSWRVMFGLGLEGKARFERKMKYDRRKMAEGCIEEIRSQKGRAKKPAKSIPTSKEYDPFRPPSFEQPGHLAVLING